MICSCRMSLRTASTESNWLAAPMVMTGASPPPVVVCSCLLQQSNKVASVFLFGSSEKKGSRAKSNGKWKSNGKCSTSHNKFL